MADDDDDKPQLIRRKRGRPPKLRVIEGDLSPPDRRPESDANGLPANVKERLKYDHKVASYCKYRALGYTHDNACMASGYDDDRPELVKRHMSLIKQGIVNTLNVTADSLLLEVEEVRQAAMLGEQYNVALAAIVTKGKIRNLIDQGAGAGGEPDKIPKPSSEPVDVTEMTLEDWKARFAPNR